MQLKRFLVLSFLLVTTGVVPFDASADTLRYQLAAGSFLEIDGEPVPLTGFFDLEFLRLGGTTHSFFEFRGLHWEAGGLAFHASYPMTTMSSPDGTRNAEWGKELEIFFGPDGTRHTTFMYGMDPDLVDSTPDSNTWGKFVLFSLSSSLPYWVGSDPTAPDELIAGIRFRETVQLLGNDDYELLLYETFAFGTMHAVLPEPSAAILVPLLVLGAALLRLRSRGFDS